MKKIVEYLPLLSICLIYFGFCNLHGFYKEFMIDIYQYITTTEIIMAFFPTIVFLSGLASTLLIQEFVGKPAVIYVAEETTEQTAAPSKLKKFFITLFQSFITWMVLMAVLHISIRQLLTHYFGYKSYDFQQFNLFAFAFSVIAVLGFLRFTGRQDMIRNNPVLVALGIVCFTGMQITNYKKLDAERIKAGIPQREISFRYHDKNIRTSKQLMYIGQTTGHIFLYERKGSKTFVYKTEGVDSLVIIQ